MHDSGTINCEVSSIIDKLPPNDTGVLEACNDLLFLSRAVTVF